MPLAGTGNQRGSTNGTPFTPYRNPTPSGEQGIHFIFWENRKDENIHRQSVNTSPVPQFPSSPIPSPSHTAVQGDPSRHSASIPFPWRVGTASIRSGHRRHIRCDRSSARRRRFPDENNVDPFGENKPSRIPQNAVEPTFPRRPIPVADLHFRKQAGPCSLMSWKNP